MRVFAYINLPTDHPYWISRNNFEKYFDQTDFDEYRHVANPKLAYSDSWFYRDGNRVEFIIPVVHFIANRTQFINGRHRTKVLLSAMEEIPIAFALSELSSNSNQLLQKIPKRPLDANQPFEILDLPIRSDF